MQLRGDVRISEGAESIRLAALTVRLLDVSRADASAKTVGLTTLEKVSLTVDEAIDFVLEVDHLDPHNTYSLAAWFDVDGSGDVTIGDYRTMEHFDVSSETIGQHHSILCRQIL